MKAGKLATLQAMESEEYIRLLQAFADTAGVRGRPTENKKFDWSLVEGESSGTRDAQELVSVFLCQEDFIDYYVNQAPHYERCLARPLLIIHLIL